MVADERSPLLSQPSLASNHIAGTEREESVPSGTLSVLLALLGVFIASADESLVITIYGTISSEFKNLSDGHFLMTGYILGYCVALPVYGRISDMYGRKKPLLSAYCLFGLGCGISGMAISLWQVIIGRVIAGIGGAGMIALISVIITDIATLKQVAVLRSFVNAAAVAGRSSGVPLGGLLADTIGWRWSFLSQVPIALVLFSMTAWGLPSKVSKVKELHSRSDHASPTAAKLSHIDFPGLVTFILTMTTFLLILSLGGRKFPWDHPVILSLAAACMAFGIFFVLIQGLIAENPLIPLRLLRSNGVGVFCVVQTLLFIARFAFLGNLANYYIRTKDASNTVAAAYIVPSSLGNAVGALLAAYMINRTSRYKTLSIISLSIGLFSYLLITIRWRHGTNVWESFYVFPVGLGFGMILSTQFVGLTASAPKAQSTTAVSVYYLSQQIGSIIGIATSAALLRYVFSHTLLHQLKDCDDRDAIIQGILEDARFANSLPKATQSIVRSSYLKSFPLMPVMSAVVSLLTFPFVVCLSERHLG